MKWGLHTGHRRREFWKSLQLPGEWIEGETAELVAAKVAGIFVNPDDSDRFYRESRQIIQQVEETRFIDFLEVNERGLRPVTLLRTSGAEIFVRGNRHLDTRLRAYITGVGPWSRLFALLAIEKGFADVQIVVDEKDQAATFVSDLKKFCFGVKIEEIQHADLTLQANSGGLLVNAMGPGSSSELMEDLAYLNYLSPSALVIDTQESPDGSVLQEEARNSKLAVLDGAFTQGFAEYQALRLARIPLTLEEYLAKRASFAG
jgi:hypothetical protein